MILSTTKTIATLPHLTTFLADRPNAVVGWGRKRSGRQAEWIAKVFRRPLALLEDGFIRSVERHAPPLSLLIDDLGVYYDATRPSRMERVIAGGIGSAENNRARVLIERWRDNRISKYNHAAEYDGALPETYVLVIDQTLGDLSIAKGQAEASSFAAMLDAALAENPGVPILVKVHPDVLSGRKHGHFEVARLTHPRVQVLGVDCHPVRLLVNARSIYAVTSLMGFEGLLWGKPVRCFGRPFYAGWGLTEDEMAPAPRRKLAALEDVVHASLVTLARYADPENGTRWEVEQAMDHVAGKRQALFEQSQVEASFQASPPL